MAGEEKITDALKWLERVEARVLRPIDPALRREIAKQLADRLAALEQALQSVCRYCSGKWPHYEREARYVEAMFGREWRHYVRDGNGKSYSLCELTEAQHAALRHNGEISGPGATKDRVHIHSGPAYRLGPAR